MSKIVSLKIADRIKAPEARSAFRGMSRPRLTGILNNADAPRATLLHAPAGYGKSFLLQQIKDEQAAAGIQCRGITLGEHDRDSGRLEAWLSTAFGPSSGSADTPLIALVDGLERVGGHLGERTILRLIETLPPNTRLLVASRTYPSRGTARLRLGAHLALIEAEDLCFSAAELREWLETNDLHFTSSEIAEFMRLTNGWPAAVGMATIALTASPTKSADFMAGDIAAWPLLQTYVAEEILAPLPSEVREFALEAASLVRFSAELAATVTGRANALDLTAQLERSGIVVRESNEHATRGWLRYQPLVAQCMEQELAHKNPTRWAELHHAAMVHHKAEGRLSDAIRHAFAAADPIAASDLLDAASRERRRLGRASADPEWSRRLPDEGFDRNPSLHVDAACSLASRFELEAARSHLATARRHFQDLEPAVRDDLYAVDGMIALYGDRPEQCLETAERGLRECHDASPYTLGTLRSIAAIGWISRSSLDNGRRMALEAIADNKRAGSSFGAAIAQALVGLTDMIGGGCTTALETWALAERMMQGEKTEKAASKIAFAYVPAALYESNRIGEAEDYIERCLSGPMEIVLPDMLTSFMITEVRLASLSSNPVRIERALGQGDRIAAQMGWPRLGAAMAWERLRIAVLAGDGQKATRLHTDIVGQKLFEEPAGIITHALETEANLVGELRFRTYFALDPSIVSRASAAAAKALASNRMIRVIKLLTIEAICRDALGDRSAAIRTMRRAVLHAAPGGIVRSIADEGPRALALVKAVAATTALDEVPRSYLDALCAEDPMALPRLAETPVQIEALSDREREILRLVFDGHSNAQVARNASLSENTVKWHLQNIYSKLGVGNRTSAVAVARSLGLFR
ncbi:LuxR family maltose regulon positive regulatory protein [Sphingomonas sp. UYAg733]